VWKSHECITTKCIFSAEDVTDPYEDLVGGGKWCQLKLTHMQQPFWKGGDKVCCCVNGVSFATRSILYPWNENTLCANLDYSHFGFSGQHTSNSNSESINVLNPFHQFHGRMNFLAFLKIPLDEDILRNSSCDILGRTASSEIMVK